MKKLINGRLYDEDNGDSATGISEQLYSTETGDIFISAYGSAMSKYAINGMCGRHIIPVTKDMAREWAKEHLNTEDYEYSLDLINKVVRREPTEKEKIQAKKQALIERAELIIESSACADYIVLELKIRDWSKPGISRTYISIIERSTNYKVSRHYSEKKYGYIDNLSGEYIPDKNDLRKNLNFGGNPF